MLVALNTLEPLVKHLHGDFFDSLFCRYLRGNPFHCNCTLEHLRSKLVRNYSSYIQDGESIQCSTPLQFKNKALKSLTDLCGKLKVKHPGLSNVLYNYKFSHSEMNLCFRYFFLFLGYRFKLFSSFTLHFTAISNLKAYFVNCLLLVISKRTKHNIYIRNGI